MKIEAKERSINNLKHVTLAFLNFKGGEHDPRAQESLQRSPRRVGLDG